MPESDTSPATDMDSLLQQQQKEVAGMVNRRILKETLQKGHVAAAGGLPIPVPETSGLFQPGADRPKSSFNWSTVPETSGMLQPGTDPPKSSFNWSTYRWQVVRNQLVSISPQIPW